MIKGVTFDWWETIAATPWPDYDERMRKIRVERMAEAFAARGLVVETEDLYRAYDRHTELLLRRWREHTDLNGEEQIRAFLDFAGLEDADLQLSDAIAVSFGEAIRVKLPILFPHIGSALAALKARGYRIGLVSNTGRTWGRFLRPIQDEMGIGKYFDDRVFSDEVGVRKPDPRIFRTALEHLALRPEEVAHVGDNRHADVAGAKAAGMRAIWFNGGIASPLVIDPPAGPAVPPDAEVRDHREVLEVLERWRP